VRDVGGEKSGVKKKKNTTVEKTSARSPRDDKNFASPETVFLGGFFFDGDFNFVSSRPSRSVPGYGRRRRADREREKKKKQQLSPNTCERSRRYPLCVRDDAQTVRAGFVRFHPNTGSRPKIADDGSVCVARTGQRDPVGSD
jgi:hypothetical protein